MDVLVRVVLEVFAEFQVKLAKACPIPEGAVEVTHEIKQVDPEFQVAVGTVPPFRACS